MVTAKYKPRRDGDPSFAVGNDIPTEDMSRVIYRPVFENHIITGADSLVRFQANPRRGYRAHTLTSGHPPHAPTCLSCRAGADP